MTLKPFSVDFSPKVRDRNVATRNLFMSESLFCNELGGYEIGGFGHFHGIRFCNPEFSRKSIRQNPLEARTVAWFLVSKAAEHVPLHSAPFEHGLVQSDSEIS